MRIYSAAQLGRKTLFINFDGLNIDNLHSYQLSRFLIEINDINSINNFLKIKIDKNNSRLENTQEPNKNEDAKKSLNTKIKNNPQYLT